jgi:tryptophan synthase alpha chain
MNRIREAFINKKNILSIYFTAGYPNLDDTMAIIKELDKSGVDMIEIGLPFSDPLADGPTIQESSTKALINGMNTNVLFEQINNLRSVTNLPIIIMGYLNPIIQFGIEKFCKKCKQCEIDGLIIPDLPVDIYYEHYHDLFKDHDLQNMFLITPQTSEKRIRFIDEISDGFIYMVSSYSTTGAQKIFGDETIKYFKRINQMKLKSPLLVGFGISNKETRGVASINSNGVIIGSAYINMLTNQGIKQTKNFINTLKIN